MGSIIDKITEFIKEMLQGWVLDNLETMFTDVNTKVGTIAGEVGQTPSSWNAGIFSMIDNLSDTVMVPIAGMIISAILCYELITMVMDKNNMHEMGSEFFFRYLVKACIAVLLVSYTSDITMAIFDVGNHIVTSAAGVITGSTTLDVTSTLQSMFNSQLSTMGIGELIGLGIETMIVSLCMKIISLLITVMLYGRMIEIYLYVSVAPVPFATLSNREWGGIVIISRDFVLWHFRDFSSWYVWQSMQCWYPVLQLQAIFTRLCGRWQHIPLFCASAYLRQVPLANLFLMHIKAALYQEGGCLWQYQSQCRRI